ncbi:MAG: copper chaperone PCu(A)C [Gammaproteobacteria bacterium]|nr:copper chaperone PCu(A)C [Gammaproteobacteria bacterium]MYD79792.1 copper chaperone PCu(A)C [Gammaproteobacteria bacterium]
MKNQAARTRTFGIWLLVAVAICLLVFSIARKPSQIFVIKDGWIRAPVASSSMTAGYCVFTNRGEQDITVVSARSPSIGKIEFHESRYEDEMHRMVQLPSLVIPAKGTLRLEPGGKHLMLFNLMDKEASVNSIEFTLSTGELIEYAFVVEDP